MERKTTMLVLFILGAFGVKAALVVYLIYRCARWVSQKGDTIKHNYELEIADLKAKNKRLSLASSTPFN